MAQLARLEFTIQDSAGNALTGVSVEVRRQGAQVSGAHAGAQTTFNVDDPGAIIAGDTLAANTGSVTRVVNSITATTVVVGGLGFNNLADDDRLTIAGALPTLYTDAVLNETRANPLTTDANGYAFCYLLGGKYDVLISGGGATTRLLQDVAAVGGETMRSNIFSGTAWKLDSLRVLGATDIALDVSSAGTNKFKVMGDGEVVAGAAGATHSLTGSLAVSNGAAVTGAITATTSMAATTTVTGGTGVTATTGNVTATAGFVNGFRYQAAGTAITTADVAISGLWGATATKTVLAGSTDTRGSIRVDSAGAGVGADATIVLTFKDGTFTTNPYIIVCGDWTNTSAAKAGEAWTASPSGATQAVFLHHDAPVAGSFYGFSYFIIK